MKKITAWVLVMILLMNCNFINIVCAEEITIDENQEVMESGFQHPGMLHTEESFDKIRKNIENQVQPNLDTWNLLKSDGFSAAGWQPRTLETVIRGGDGENSAQFYIDIRRAYQTALMWKIGGSEEHRQAALRIANAWADTMTGISGNADRFLAAGIYGYELANVAELLRDEPEFHLEEMKNLLLNVFYPMNNDFLTNHNGAHIGNYWANWDLCSLASMISIGIFCDREDIFNQAVNYYKTGLGNGSIYNAIPFVYDDKTAQWQEAGRDQGHTTLGVGLCEAICEMAWNQGVDLYGLSDNRFLKGAEYVAKYNNGEEVQYTPYEWLKGQTGSSEWQSEVSEASRGAVRPIYTMLYNHYVKRMGLSAPNIEKMLFPEDGTYTIEGAQSNGDELGWQTLTFANLYEGAPMEKTNIQGDFGNGTYRIRSVLTEKSIVVSENGNLASAQAGTNAAEWWTFSNTGDGEYIITNTVTGKVMEISENYYDYLSVLGTGTANGGLNQKFAILKNSTGDYRIIPAANFYSLDILNLQTDDDTPIIQYRYYSGEGQRWIVESYEYVQKGPEEAEKIEQARKDLNQVLEEADEIGAEGYAADSWQAFQEAVVQAKALVGRLDVSSEELFAAIDGVKTAIGALRRADLTPIPTDTPMPTAPAAVVKTFTVKGIRYKVTDSAAVKVMGMQKKVTKVQIPAKVKYKSKSYKVTAINKNAFKGQKSMKKLVIGKNVTTIGAKAFYGCKNLKNITIKGKALKKVKKTAFKKISSKATAKVNKNMKKKYKKLLKGKNVKVL